MNNQKTKNLGAISAFISLIAFSYYCFVNFLLYDGYKITLEYYDKGVVSPMTYSVDLQLKLVFFIASAVSIFFGIISFKKSKTSSSIGICMSLVLLILVLIDPLIYLLA